MYCVIKISVLLNIACVLNLFPFSLMLSWTALKSVTARLFVCLFCCCCSSCCSCCYNFFVGVLVVVLVVIIYFVDNLVMGTAHAEIKFPLTKNSYLSKLLPLKPGVTQNIALRASPVARNFGS